MTQSTKDFSDAINNISRSANFSEQKLDVLATHFGDVDDSVLNAAKSLQRGEISLDTFNETMNNSSTATSAFGATLKTVAANMAIMIAVTAAIKGVAWVIDEIVVTTAELEEAAKSSADELKNLTSKSESLNSELSTTKDRMEELESKPSLSFVEQEELQKLRDVSEELERQINLNDALRQVTQSEARDTALDFLNSKENYEQYGNWDMSSVNNGASHYGKQDTGNIFQGSQLEVAKQQLIEYEDLLARKQDVERRLTDFRTQNPDDSKYTLEQKDALMNLEMELASYDSTIKSLSDTLYEAVPKLDSFKSSLNPDYDEKYINYIEEITSTYSRLFGSAAEDKTQKFNNIWNSKDFARYREELIKLETAGRITDDVLTSNKNYNRLIEETGANAEEVIQNIKSLVDEMNRLGEAGVANSHSISELITLLNDFEETFEPVNKLYQEFLKNGTGKFSNDNLQSVINSFKDIDGVNIEDFLDTLTNTASTAEDVQKAFNNLASEYSNVSGILDQVTESNADYIASKLKEIGITNSVALVEAELTVQRNEAALAAKVMSGATYGELAALRDEIAITDEAKFAINQFYLEKLTANGISLATNGDIENIMSLIQACGGGISALKAFHDARQGIFQAFQQTLSTENWKAGTPIGQAAARENLEAQMAEFSKQQDKLIADSQREVDAALNKKYSGSGGGYGGNATNKSGSGGGSGSGSGLSAKKDPTVYDWMERRLEIIDNQVDKLQSKIEDLVGYKAKNTNTDTAIDLMTEKMSILQQMYERYNEEANKIGLAQEYVDKVQNGTIDIESISDESLVSQINDFKEWYEKAEDVSNKIDDVIKSIHELNISKLDNIIDQFDKLSDMQSQLIRTEEQLLDLREKSGDTIYADDYLSLGEKQLELTRQNLDAYNALAAEMSKQNLEKGSDEWKTYNNQLQEYKNNMISAAEATETYKDSMTDLVYKELDDFKSKMDSINGTISTMNSLIGDVDLIDDSGNLTDRGLAQVALYAQQLANSKQEAANYAEAIDSLEDALDSGLITQDEYNERLYDYTSAQESAVQSTKDAKDAMIALVKEGIQAQIDAKKKLTDETIAALEAEQDLHNYQNDINEKQKNITTLQKKIAALAGATSGTELATRLQLEQELLDAQKELYETQYDHNIEQQKNALNEAYDVYEQEKQDEMDELDSNLSAQEKAIEQYLNEVKNNYSTVYDILTQYGDSYSLSAINDLTSPWKSGSDAAYLCADAMGEAIANINYEISNIDMSPLYELIDALNSIGEYGMGGSSSQFEDVTNQGEWKKSSGRWWYGNSSDDYVSGGIYTIDGKQYGFGDDGYMLEGWNDDTGEWKYFEPGSGVMTRSAWKQDKKGNWFYLDKNGSMATDSVVKAQSGDGYYYVNDDGMWDGETLSYDEIRKRGLVVAYKDGTRRVGSDQLAWTQEEAPEIITRPSDSSMLVPLKADDGVLKGDLTENLMKMATDPSRFIQQISTPNIPSVLSRDLSPISVDMQVNIEGNADEKTIGLMHDMMVDFTKNEMFNVIKKSGYKYRK